jgi:hypothetical protein
MTSGQRPYGGTNDPGNSDHLPGERPERDEVGADPAAEPRATQTDTMSDAEVPADPTGPTG